MKGKMAVVTGGAGFIGSHVARQLSEGNEVVILDDFSTGKPENISDISNLPNVEVVRGSILDLDLLHRCFRNADYVFHLAADPNVVDSVLNPLRTNAVNITGTLNTLLAARDRGVKKVVYSSSSAIYGAAPVPNVETMNPDLSSPYALSKLAGEYYCQLFSRTYALPTVALRYFNVYGPKQDANSAYAAVIPRFIQRLLGDRPPTIYGDGEQTRDFIFVADVARANIMASELDPTEQVFNIGSGQSISINQLAARLGALLGKSLRPEYAAPQPGDVKYSLADISRSQNLLGFGPTWSLEKGLEETIAYFRTLWA